MRYIVGEQHRPKAGPHKDHVLQVAGIETTGRFDKVQIKCLICLNVWHFVHNWGRFE